VSAAAIRKPVLLQLSPAVPATAGAVRSELLGGLLAPTAEVSPKYLYDALGSRLFSAITELPEYYLTRTESAIFARALPEMAAALGPARTLVDLGAGNCEKAAQLFSAFAVERYVAIDISAGHLADALTCLQRLYPAIEMLGIGLDFSSSLHLPEDVGTGPRTIFYPGSSIGNFTPAAALRFLRQMHAASAGGGLLIGVDLAKPASVLEPAYDDPLGVTAAFNRNLLLHLNRLAGTDFDIADWRHIAFFNTAESRIEMHLEATRSCTVRWAGEGGREAEAAPGRRDFVAGERLHTENSYKWRLEDFAALLEAAGFSRLQHWTDERNWFAVFAARAG
jgi:L-histidine N-alpha-methyltransferase